MECQVNRSRSQFAPKSEQGGCSLPGPLESHFRHRSLCEGVFTSLYGRAQLSEPLPLAELEVLRDGSDEQLNITVMGDSEYLERMLSRMAWWLTVADMARDQATTGMTVDEADKTLPLFIETRAKLAEALALVPLSWAETYSSVGDEFRTETGQRLIGRYLEFRESAISLVVAAWPAADLERLRDLA